ncbi:hypothetical protein HYW41_02255 [Candidatus Daviesbacteria bacterium]|nr:hypothetical protein [Candidatus Daviesbacteria bacterium]
MLKSKIAIVFLALLIILHTFLLSRLIFFPYPELFVYPYLTNRGLKPYQQILDQHFPGLMFLPINFDNLGMKTPEVARLWLISVVSFTHLLLFLISSKILKSKFRALLVNLLYLIWQPFFEGWVLWIDSLLPIVLLPAYYALYKRKFFLTGLLLGMGIIFKQVLIPLAGLVLIYIFWEMREVRVIRRYLYGLGLPLVFVTAYLFSIGVLGDFWYWTIVFNMITYVQFGRGMGPSFAHFARVALVFGIASFILLKIKTRDAQLLLIFLFGTLFGLSTRFDFVHFQPALPFAALATAYIFWKLGGSWVVKVFAVGYLLTTVWWLVTFYRGHLGEKILFFDKQTVEVASKIRRYTKNNDKIFVFGAAPNLYQMSDRLPAGDIFVFQFPWFLMAAEDRLLAGIIKDQPQIIVSDRNTEIEGRKISDFAPKLDKYIIQNYHSIDKVGTVSILNRNP